MLTALLQYIGEVFSESNYATVHFSRQRRDTDKEWFD